MPASPFLALALAALLTDGYAESAAQARELWARWIAAEEVERAYSSAEVAGARVLVFRPAGTSASQLAGRSGRTVKAFDAIFAASARDASVAPPRTAVLVSLAGPKSFASVTRHLGEAEPRLADWAQSAPSGTGFLLEDPLVAGWLEKVSEIEVWSPENELVNRLARLLTIERFGRQPQWIAQGLAWHVELTVCKDVYCFPYRSGFVSKKEHKSWPAKVAEAMAQRGEAPIRIEELTGWARNTWDEARATLAYAAAAMLAKHYPAELARVLDAFTRVRVADGRATAADGSWTWIADYEIPAERQLEVLNAELGADFLAELAAYASKPKSYHRPR
jgi:hypothetical protein